MIHTVDQVGDIAAFDAKDFTAVLIQNADHALRDTTTGEGVPYWDIVIDWLAERGFIE